MKPNVSRMLLPAGLVLALAALSLTAHAADAQSSAAGANDLAGSWLFTLNRTLPFPAQVLALGTFSKEGTFTGTAQGDGICCPTEGPAHGAWKKTGHNTFALTFNTLWYLGDSPPSLFGILKLNMTLTLDEKPERLTGVFSGAVVDPNGNVAIPLQGSLTAERIRVE